MAKRSIQGFAELATGLGEMTKAAANDAAAELLSVSAAAPKAGKKLAKQASQLADGLLDAAEKNREQVVALIRHEVDGVGAQLEQSFCRDLSGLNESVQQLLGQLDGLREWLPGQG